MKYMLLIYVDPDLRQQEIGADVAKESAAYGTYTQSLITSGLMRGGDALEGSDAATTVRLRGEQRLVTDGPFAETREVLGGYYVIEAADLDAAIEAAANCPGARTGSMEVRPIRDVGM
jgi:hypothetical protein